MGKSSVIRMIQNGDVPLVFAPIDLHSNIVPIGALPFRLAISFSISINYFTSNTFTPWHTKKQTPDIKFFQHNIRFCFPAPFKVKEKFSIGFVHTTTFEFR